MIRIRYNFRMSRIGYIPIYRAYIILVLYRWLLYIIIHREGRYKLDLHNSHNYLNHHCNQGIYHYIFDSYYLKFDKNILVYIQFLYNSHQHYRKHNPRYKPIYILYLKIHLIHKFHTNYYHILIQINNIN